jgi:stalled ribosome alternative rescue factor ArfA
MKNETIPVRIDTDIVDAARVIAKKDRMTLKSVLQKPLLREFIEKKRK